MPNRIETVEKRCVNYIIVLEIEYSKKLTLRDEKINQFLVLHKFGTQFMAFVLYDKNSCPPTQYLITPDKLTAVVLKRDDFIYVAMYVKDRDIGISKIPKSIDGIVLVKAQAELTLVHTVGIVNPFCPKISLEIAHRINTTDTFGMLRILDCPVICHQSSATLAEQTCFVGKFEFPYHQLI